MSNSPITILPLGAGREVGRSCILVTIKGRRIMLDCGAHMEYTDSRRFPSFDTITADTSDLSSIIDCVIISHFHLDHTGALPYFSESIGYSGPIFMTHPTRGIIPPLLEDFLRVSTMNIRDKPHRNRPAFDENQNRIYQLRKSDYYTSTDIKNCLKKVISLSFNETLDFKGIKITPYPAGHVLGAAAFHIQVEDQSILYTGDYSFTPDRHLYGSHLPQLNPSILVTETTYGTIVRSSRAIRERHFITTVVDVLQQGGKVLAPVFALGRVQELCALVEEHWTTHNMTAPVYYTQGLAEKSMGFYRGYGDMMRDLTSDNAESSVELSQDPLFVFQHVRPFHQHLLTADGPCLLFASPGMLNGGVSLEALKVWGKDPKNAVVLCGYCVQGSVGARVQNGEQRIQADGVTIEVNCKVFSLSFSAHTDLSGITSLIKQTAPSVVMCVHGEESRMDFVRDTIQQQMGIPCITPQNGIPLDVVVSQPPPSEEGELGSSRVTAALRQQQIEEQKVKEEQERLQRAEKKKQERMERERKVAEEREQERIRMEEEERQRQEEEERKKRMKSEKKLVKKRAKRQKEQMEKEEEERQIMGDEDRNIIQTINSPQFGQHPPLSIEGEADGSLFRTLGMPNSQLGGGMGWLGTDMTQPGFSSEPALFSDSLDPFGSLGGGSMSFGNGGEMIGSGQIPLSASTTSAFTPISSQMFGTSGQLFSPSLNITDMQLPSAFPEEPQSQMFQPKSDQTFP